MLKVRMAPSRATQGLVLVEMATCRRNKLKGSPKAMFGFIRVPHEE